MKLIRWKRIGQSGQELVAAILFSFIIHGMLIAAFLLFSLVVVPKLSVPISYQVMLVSDPAAIEPALPQEVPPQPLKPAEAPAQKKIAPAPRAKQQASAKSAMPDFGASKAEKNKIEEQADKESPTAPPGTASPVGDAAKKEAVAVSAGQQNQLPGLSGYLPLVREKIARNWNPPPGVREAKSKVMFKILRSGRVVEVKLQESSGNVYFDLAANRAILSAGSFPQLPDEYPREYLEISVDLAEKN